MKRTSFFAAVFIISPLLHVGIHHAFEISLGAMEEVCLTRRNMTDEKCVVKDALVEIRGLLSEMKKERTKLNNEINLINEKLARAQICNKVYDSCADVLKENSNAKNGVYRIKTKTSKHYSNVYCHMTTLSGCSGGGWTMIIKINGSKETFAYSSPYWGNRKSYSKLHGETGIDYEETKLATYWSTPFSQLCVGMKVDATLRFISITHKARSLFDIIADGRFRPTSIPRETWKSLLVNSSLQPNCGRQGFNVIGTNSESYARVRIGIIGNGENECGSVDSFIGFGGLEASTRNYCHGRSRGITNSCGNSAYCGSDNGNREIKAMGYIFVR